MFRGFPYRATKIAWSLLLLLANATGLYVLHVLLTTNWTGARETTAVIFDSLPRLDNAILFVHVATALPALLIGIWEFLPSLRKGYALNLHRWFGKIYVIGIFVSSSTGFVLALHNVHGWAARAGFATLAVTWFTTTWFAYTTVLARDLEAHRRWMIRSYGVTLAVVTVRLLAKPKLGIEPADWYPIMTWLCWVPNVAVAEIYVRLTDFKGRVSIGRGRARRTTAVNERSGLTVLATDS
jgi:uncharacterized membrane protein